MKPLLDQGIKAVLFDNDGTLVDTKALLLETFHQVLPRVLPGVTFSEQQLVHGIGKPLEEQLHEFTSDEACYEQLLNEYRIVTNQLLESMVRKFDGMDALLDALQKRGVALAVVTSKREQPCRVGLRKCGIEHFFNFVVSPDNYTYTKPDARPVLHACELLNVAPHQAVFVGDSPYDMMSGTQAGVTTVAVTWGISPRTQIEEMSKPDYWCESVEDLSALLFGASDTADTAHE